jgi:hypothetical protein
MSWGWYPMPLLRRSLFKQHPWWGVYAAVQPIAVALMIGGITFAVTRRLANALNIVL